MRPCVPNEAQTSLGLSQGFEFYWLCSYLYFSYRVSEKGLVHAHIILFLDQSAKFSLQDPLEVDKIISAEILSNSTPELRNTVLRFMIHKPCTLYSIAPCIKDGKFSKRFSKPFRSETSAVEGDNYVTYKRRSPEDGGEFHQIPVGNGSTAVKFKVDNSWVVPYSPDLLGKFRTHMNVELCIYKVGSIKYLFKYVCEGSDRMTVEIRTTADSEKPNCAPKSIPTIEEIQQYQDARCISASEAAWRLFSFPMVEHQPTVERLEVHLEGRHTVYFGEGEHQKAKETGKDKLIKLMAWFHANEQFPSTRHISYADFPKYFRWDKVRRNWVPRAKYKMRGSGSAKYDFSVALDQVVGRMYNISPREGERYFFETTAS